MLYSPSSPVPLLLHPVRPPPWCCPLSRAATPVSFYLPESVKQQAWVPIVLPTPGQSSCSLTLLVFPRPSLERPFSEEEKAPSTELGKANFGDKYHIISTLNLPLTWSSGSIAVPNFLVLHLAVLVLLLKYLPSSSPLPLPLVFSSLLLSLFFSFAQLVLKVQSANCKPQKRQKLRNPSNFFVYADGSTSL